MEDEEGEEEEWTIDDLHLDARPVSAFPTQQNARKLISDYRSFLMSAPSDVRLLGKWVWQSCTLAEGMPINWHRANQLLGVETYRVSRLRRFIQIFPRLLDDGEVGREMREIDGMRHIVRELIVHTFRVASLGSGGAQLNFPDPEREETPEEMRTLANHDATSLKAFQSIFIKIHSVLLSCDLRRADGKFFERVLTTSGLPTQTFRPLLTVEEFINEHTKIEDNFEAWLDVTHSASVYPQLVDYLKTRPLCSAPDLSENAHLRSYEGDEYGRFAVIYDCAQDMAWRLCDRAHWQDMGRQMDAMRKRIFGAGNFIACVPPKAEDVCVKHMMAEFPYDTFEEAMEVCAAPRGAIWRECQLFECCHGDAHEVDSERLRSLMDQRFPIRPDTGSEWEDDVWGRTWQLAVVTGEETRRDALLGRLEEFPASETEREMIQEGRPLYHTDLTCCHRLSKVTITDAEVYVPLLTPARRRRGRLAASEVAAVVSDIGRDLTPLDWACVPPDGLRWERVGSFRPDTGTLLQNDALERALRSKLSFSEEEWRSFGVPALTRRHYVFLEGEKLCFRPICRYFRPHTGRVWDECVVPEIQQIYNCQNFGCHDRFLLYAFKGRTLFRVGELDRSQLTLFIEGTGGCGKSTLMKTMQLFWSHHRMGILSSNIEAKFGMSQVLRGAVKDPDEVFPKSQTYAIFCNEVSRDLLLVQEEWQTSCSGEVGSYAVKHKAPLECICQAQHFWVGNEFPSHFKNDQQQVSRRIAGVRMSRPVEPRNESIFDHIRNQIGTLQRCIVLAYQEYRRQMRDTDPMSVPTRLPPAFQDYYFRKLNDTKPIDGFIADGKYVRPSATGLLTETEFKRMLDQWCTENGIKRIVGRLQDHCTETFNRYSITITRPDSVIINGEPVKNQVVFAGIEMVNPPEMP